MALYLRRKREHGLAFPSMRWSGDRVGTQLWWRPRGVSSVFGISISLLMGRIFRKAVRLVNDPYYKCLVATPRVREAPTITYRPTMRVVLELLRGGGKCSWEKYIVDTDRRKVDRGGSVAVSGFIGSDTTTHDCHAMRKTFHFPPVPFPLIEMSSYFIQALRCLTQYTV